MNLRTISVIIPSRNEEKYIADCVESIINLDYNSELLEIIIVDGNSDDQTLSIVKTLQNNFKNIKLINNPFIYTPHALNIGIKNASNEFVLIAGAHSKFSSNYIKECLRIINQYGCDGAGGILITDVKNKTTKSLSICKVLSNKFGVGNSMFRIGTGKPTEVDIVPFGLYRKELFKDIGFYNELLIRNQDMEFSKRLLSNGKRIFLTPYAHATYFARETFTEIAKNNFGNGFWIPVTVYITRKMNSLSTRHFIPMVFLLSLIITFFGSIIYTPSLFLFSSIATAYLLTLMLISYKIDQDNTHFKFILWSFIVLHFSYGFGSLIGLFRVDYMFKKFRK